MFNFLCKILQHPKINPGSASDPSFQGVNRLFVMAYSRADNNQTTRNGQQKYYLPRIDLKKYNVIMMEEIFTIIQ